MPITKTHSDRKDGKQARPEDIAKEKRESKEKISPSFLGEMLILRQHHLRSHHPGAYGGTAIVSFYDGKCSRE